MRAPLLVSLALCTLVGAAAAAARTVDVRVVGETRRTHRLLADDVEAAKRSARRRAVEEAGGVAIRSHTLVRNFQLVSDEVVAEARGILIDERWGAPEVHGDVVRVSLAARVSPEVVAGAVCSVVRAKGAPRVGVLLPERGPGTEAVERGALEGALVAELGRACLRPVQVSYAIRDPNELSTRALLTGAAGTDFLVVGLASVSRPGERPFGLVNARLLRIADGKVLAVASAGTIEELADALLAKLIPRWQRSLLGPSWVDVAVDGASYTTMTRLKKSLAAFAVETSPVQLAQGRGFLRVQLDGGARALSEALNGKTMGKTRVDVTEVSDGHVTVRLSEATYGASPDAIK